jgi:CPA2 family monovalent cation:H+ antiporter-2
MPHETALIATVAVGLGLAFVFGLLASRAGLPPLVGYLVAGIAAGPYTPGIVADAAIAAQLAEIGVILLMFGVGVHFSVADLLAVRRIAIPGAAVEITIISTIGALTARAWGWEWSAAIVLGLCLSVASTVVVLRGLEQQGLLDSTNGRIAVGWLVVEDLAMVLALVLLPALTAGPGGGAAGAVGTTLAKVGAFGVVMYFGGRRAVPWLLERVARTGSRELFTLSVLAIALGIAFGAAEMFGVSLALGAFLAGVVVSESDLSHQAAADALPLRDAFAVLFFVSVGMLFDPAILVRQPLYVLAVLAIVMLGKSVAAASIVLAFRYPFPVALAVAASLGQIGEFSFILAGLAVTLGVLPPEGLSLVLAGSLLSIALNPLLFNATHAVERWVRARPHVHDRIERLTDTGIYAADQLPRGHAILVGHGRVGGAIAHALALQGMQFIVLERDRVTVESLRRRGVTAFFGDASRPLILERARPAHARLLIVTAPDPYYARMIIENARRVNPSIDVVARTHSAGEQAFLENTGARAVLAEREVAFAIAHYALQSMGCSDDDADVAVQALRDNELYRTREIRARKPPAR